MNIAALNVTKALYNYCTRTTLPLDILKEGVRLLNKEPLSGSLKREILIEIIRMFAYGDDGIENTVDDRLSPETVKVLITLIENNTLDLIIDGIVKSDYSTFRKCFKRIFG